MPPTTKTTTSLSEVPPLRDAPILSAQEESKESTTTASNNLYFDHYGGGGGGGEGAAEESKEISPGGDDTAAVSNNIEVQVSVKNETHCEIQGPHSTSAAKIAVSEKNGDSVHSTTTTIVSSSNSSKMSHGGGGAALWRQRMQDSLYERVEEESTLQKAFEKCTANNTMQGQQTNNKTDFLLISGPCKYLS